MKQSDHKSFEPQHRESKGLTGNTWVSGSEASAINVGEVSTAYYLLGSLMLYLT